MRAIAAFSLTICFSLLLTGCGGETTSKKSEKKAHNHAHDDGEAHGDHFTNNPHKIELKDAPFNALWGHAGDLVSFTIVDNDYKKEMPIKADSVLVVDVGGKNKFTVPALKKDENGMACEFELESEDLEATLDSKPTFSVTVDGKTYSTTVLHVH